MRMVKFLWKNIDFTLAFSFIFCIVTIATLLIGKPVECTPYVWYSPIVLGGVLGFLFFLGYSAGTKSAGGNLHRTIAPKNK